MQQMQVEVIIFMVEPPLANCVGVSTTRDVSWVQVCCKWHVASKQLRIGFLCPWGELDFINFFAMQPCRRELAKNRKYEPVSSKRVK